MSGTNGTLFQTESGSTGGASDYVADVFPDVSLKATSNSGLTDNSNTNPLGLYFGNADTPLFGVKTLYIKELKLIKDRSKWYNNQATYQIIFNENYPQIQAFYYGTVSYTYKTGVFSDNSKTQLVVKNLGGSTGGVLVTGLCRRVGFILDGIPSANQTGTIYVDGSSDGSVDVSDVSAASNSTLVARHGSYINSTTQTYDLHTFRLENDSSDSLSFVGIQVYFQNSGSNIEFRPGTTYSNKIKASTTSGASLAIPTYGSTLGGIALFYKSTSGAYLASSQSHTTITSIGVGSNGASDITVTTGHGASFLEGYGVVCGSGSTFYVGSVTGVSTDTLTVSPALPFGVSNTIYRAWYSNATYAINASLYIASSIIDFSQEYKYAVGGASGFSNVILDPQGKWAVSGDDFGIRTINSDTQGLVFNQAGANGFIVVQGNFAAADIEYYGSGAITHSVVRVNGTPGYTDNGVMTGAVRRTLVSELGTGWNQIKIAPGASNSISNGIKRITLFDRRQPIGQTTGLLACLPTQQGYVMRIPGASQMSLGTHRRVHADQLLIRGSSWTRNLSSTVSGGVYYASTGAGTIEYDFFGKDFAILGTAGGCTVLLDGAAIGASFNLMIPVATEGPHTLKIQAVSGTEINAIDYVRTYQEVKSLQKIVPEPDDLFTPFQNVTDVVRVATTNGTGGTNTKVRVWTTTVINKGDAISYSTSAASGGSWTIMRPGLYAISYSDGYGNFGIGLNSSSLTTNPESLTDGSVIAISSCANDNAGCAATVMWLNQGDVVYALTNNATNASTANRASFTIQRLVSYGKDIG